MIVGGSIQRGKFDAITAYRFVHGRCGKIAVVYEISVCLGSVKRIFNASMPLSYVFGMSMPLNMELITYNTK